MPMKPIPMTARLLPAILLAAFLGGCDDDPSAPAGSGTVLVEVVDLATGDPDPGVKLMLLDAAENLPASAAAVSDSSGGALFADVPQGVYSLLALPGTGRELFSLPSSVSPAVPAGDAAAPAVNRVVTTEARPVPGSGNSISGVVVDADTGLPLDSVLIGSRDDWLGAFAGWTPTKADITGPDGKFRVEGIAIAFNPFTELLVQAEPLIVQRAGYRPLEWFANRPDSGTITGVVLEMRSTASDTLGVGGARGVVAFSGEPVAGVRVGLSFWGAFEQPPGFSPGHDARPDPGGYAAEGTDAGAPGRVAITDAGGGYEFADLEPGWYLVHAAYPLGDGYVMPQPLGPGNTANGVNPLPVLVESGAVAEADTIAVFRAIRLLSPSPGATGVGGSPRLVWTSAPEAAYYDLQLEDRFYPDIGDTVFSVPDQQPLGEEPWTVLIGAYAADGSPVGAIEAAARFAVER